MYWKPTPLGKDFTLVRYLLSHSMWGSHCWVQDIYKFGAWWRISCSQVIACITFMWRIPDLVWESPKLKWRSSKMGGEFPIMPGCSPTSPQDCSTTPSFSSTSPCYSPQSSSFSQLPCDPLTSPPPLSSLHHQDMSSAFWVSKGPYHQLHLHSILCHQVTHQ